jgi:hypothetical protein
MNDPRGNQTNISARPCAFESSLAFCGLVLAVLIVQTLCEAEERPSVLPEALQIFAIDLFRVSGTARLEQHRAENLTGSLTFVTRWCAKT